MLFYFHTRGIRVHGKLLHLLENTINILRQRPTQRVEREVLYFYLRVRRAERSSRQRGWKSAFFNHRKYTEAFFLDKNTNHMSLFLFVVQEVEMFGETSREIMWYLCVCWSLSLTFLRILYPSTCRSFSHLVRGTRKKNYESAEIYYLAALVLIEPLYNLLLYIAIKLFQNVSTLLYTP